MSQKDHREKANITEDTLEIDKKKALIQEKKTGGKEKERKMLMDHPSEAEQLKPGSRKKIGIIVGSCLAALLVIYLGFSLYFQNHFYFRSTVNGVGTSGSSAQRALEKITAKADSYELAVIDENGKKEVIFPADVDLTINIQKKEIERLVVEQNGFAWVKYLFVPKHYVIDDMITFDEEKLAQKMETLNCVQNPDVTLTQNATFVYKDQKFQVLDEVYGNQIDEEKFQKILAKALENLWEELDLKKDNCYVQPFVKSDSPELKEAVKTMNAYTDVTITYQVGNEKETIPKDNIASWLYTGDALEVRFHEDAMQEFVQSMAKKYNTYGKAKSLKTSYGPTVTVPGGNYGWKIDVNGEVAQLISDISARKDVKRDFVYSVKAHSRGENDYGDSYVEINLTAQHMFLYKNGQKILETDFVSGDLSEGNGTHVGAYKVTYKERNAVLKGRDYRTPVAYWMPFNGGEGMHDANWRRTFGGQIYKTNGSHGCINMPSPMAAKLYENIEAGFPVLVYTLEGTESKNKTDIANENAAKSVMDAINGIGAVISVEQDAYIRSVRAQYDALNSNAKKLVTNYQTLVDAENQLNNLWNGVIAAADQQAKEQAANVMNQIRSAVDLGTKEAIASAADAYDRLSDQAKKYVQQDASGYYQRFNEKRNEFGI